MSSGIADGVPSEPGVADDGVACADLAECLIPLAIAVYVGFFTSRGYRSSRRGECSTGRMPSGVADLTAAVASGCRREAPESSREAQETAAEAEGAGWSCHWLPNRLPDWQWHLPDGDGLRGGRASGLIVAALAACFLKSEGPREFQRAFLGCRKAVFLRLGVLGVPLRQQRRVLDGRVLAAHLLVPRQLLGVFRLHGLPFCSAVIRL